MFVCPLPKISQVKMKRRRRASHLGRDTLWHNGHRALAQIYFVWHNDHPATQFGRFTLWHNSRRAKQPGFIDACTRSRTHFPKTVTNHAENMKASSKAKFYSGCWTLWKIQQTPDKHRSICMLYEDKQQRWTPRTHESQCELAHQSEAKCKQSLHSEANVCRHKCDLEKSLAY